MPRSLSKSAYDIGKANEKYKIHTSYLDALSLAESLKSLLPVTVLYAPNEAFQGKVFKINDISEEILENHIFKELLWCDKLVDMRGELVESNNGRAWRISVNDDGFPCFDAIGDPIGRLPLKACIVQCDTLVRNGIVHELDTALVDKDYVTTPSGSPTENPGALTPTPVPQPPFPEPTGSCTGGATYSKNGTQVLVYQYNTTETESKFSSKCVEYTTSSPWKGYSRACFGTQVNGNETATSCRLSYDGELCASCEICVTVDGDSPTPGFSVDCRNRTGFDTGSICTPLIDRSIQQVLVAEDTTFSDIDFVFEARKCPEEPDEGISKQIVFDISIGGNLTCLEVGARCFYQISDFSVVDSANGQVAFAEEGTVWASIDVDSDFLQVGSCLKAECQIRCNKSCSCVTPDGTDCDKDQSFTPPTSSPSRMTPTAVPSLQSSAPHSTNQPSLEPPTVNETTYAPAAPASQAPSVVPTATPSLLPSILPSLQRSLRPSQHTNVFSRPEAVSMQPVSVDADPFVEYCSIILEGMQGLMSSRDILAFVQALQSFLSVHGVDDTIIVVFTEQKLRRRTRNYGRSIETVGLEVDVKVQSWEDKTPAATTVNLIGNKSEEFVSVVKERDAETFAAVQDVQAETIEAPVQPTNPPIPAANSSDKNSKILWIAAVLLVVSVISALFFCFRLQTMMTDNMAYDKRGQADDNEDYLMNPAPGA